MRLNWKTLSRRLRGKGGNRTLPSALEGVPEFARPMVAAYKRQQFARKISLALSALVLLCVLGPVCAFSGPLTALGLLAGAGAVGAIQYPTAGSIFYTQFTPSSASATCTAIKTALGTCGWSATTIGASVTFTFTANPTGGWFRVGSSSSVYKQYNFQTSLTNVDGNVLIGATIAQTATNLFNAMTLGPGAGTTYAAAMTSQSYATATNPSSAVVALSNSTSFYADGSSITGTWSYRSGTTIVGSGYNMRCATTPQGLTAGVMLDDTGGSFTRFRLASSDFTSLVSGTDTGGNTGGSGVFAINNSASRSLEFCGCAHQFCIFMLGDVSTPGTKFFMSVPYVRSAATPSQISGASNASPIVITASSAHGLQSGVDVYISDVLGNTAANGFFTVTVLSSTTFSLNSSAGNGTYTSGGAVAGPGQISRCMFAYGDLTGASYSAFRTQPSPGAQNQYGNLWVCLNQFYWGSIGYNSPSANPGLVLPVHPYTSTTCLPAYNWGLVPDLVEPRIGWAVQSGSASWQIVGQLWASFVVMEWNVIDRQQTGFDGHNWVNYMQDSGSSMASLWLAKG